MHLLFKVKLVEEGHSKNHEKQYEGKGKSVPEFELFKSFLVQIENYDKCTFQRPATRGHHVNLRENLEGPDCRHHEYEVGCR